MARLVSVIIPSFNARPWICEAVDSALAQSHSPVQVLVVDDGSNDDSLAVVRSRYGDRVLVVATEHRGLAAARNTGLRRAGGEFVQFLDADDCLDAEKIRLQMEVLAASQDCALVHADFDTFHDGRPGVRHSSPDAYRRKSRETDAWWALLSGNFIPVLTPLVRRAAITEVGGFDETLQACEDYDLWLRMAARGMRFAYLPKILASYRTRPHSLSADRERQLRATILVHARAARLKGGLSGSERALFRRHQAELREQLALQLMAGGRRGAALPWLLTAGCFQPRDAGRLLFEATVGRPAGRERFHF